MPCTLTIVRFALAAYNFSPENQIGNGSEAHYRQSTNQHCRQDVFLGHLGCKVLQLSEKTLEVWETPAKNHKEESGLQILLRSVARTQGIFLCSFP
jgi:hypothetical protein